LSPTAFESSFTSAQFLARVGFKGGSFDFESQGLGLQLQYLAVPEPTNILLALIAFASVCGSVRRRAPRLK
jgi:hypothetical protein